MNFREISPEWLKNQNFVLQNTGGEPSIDGVICKKLNPIIDDRGDLTELWSTGWPDSNKFLQPIHIYQSATNFDVIKGWHLHEENIVQAAVTRGKIQYILVDVRPDSPTYGTVNSLFLGSDKPSLLKIPTGIIYGWKALSSPEVLITNFSAYLYNPDEDHHFPLDAFLTEVWEESTK